MQSRSVTGRWVARPVASAALRGAVVLVPVVLAAGAGVLLSHVLPQPGGAWELAWLGTVLAGSTVVLFAVQALARRFLPLATLLRLTLVFPDRAPSRFAVAARSRSVRAMARWARAQADAPDGDETPAQRATAVLALAAALNAHDHRTRGHSERVRVLSLILAEEMGLDERERDRLGWAALLHDIGKLTVPSAILNKPGAPSAREWAVLHRHPVDGERIARPLHSWLGDSMAAIGEHHEKYDGTGYPHGLVGDEITLAARIVAVTDAFETMTAVRSYKKSMSAADARDELRRCTGTHFDPAVVRAFFNLSLGRITWKMGAAAWIAQLPFVGNAARAGAFVADVGSPAGAYSGALAGVGAVTVGLMLSIGGAPLPGDTATASAPSGEGSTGGEPTSLDDGSGPPWHDVDTVDADGATGPPSSVGAAPAGAPFGGLPSGGGPDGGGSPDLGDPGGPSGHAPGSGPPNGHPQGGPPGQGDRDWTTHPAEGPPGQSTKDW